MNLVCVEGWDIVDSHKTEKNGYYSVDVIKWCYLHEYPTDTPLWIDNREQESQHNGLHDKNLD